MYERSRGHCLLHNHGTLSTSKVGGSWWSAAVGGWRFVAVGGGWRLAVGCWWGLLVVGGGWRSVVGGLWTLTKKLGLLTDTPAPHHTQPHLTQLHLPHHTTPHHTNRHQYTENGSGKASNLMVRIRSGWYPECMPPRRGITNVYGTTRLQGGHLYAPGMAQDLGGAHGNSSSNGFARARYHRPPLLSSSGSQGRVPGMPGMHYALCTMHYRSYSHNMC